MKVELTSENKVLLVLILSAILITIGSYTYVFAEDSIESMKITHKSNPMTCIMIPEPEIQDRFNNSLLKLTYDVVSEWEDTMTNYTFNTKLHTADGWHLPIKVVDYPLHFDKKTTEFPECNIFIEYSRVNEQQHIDNENALGFTSINFRNSSHQWTYVMIYIEGPKQAPVISLCVGCNAEQEQEQQIRLTNKNTIVPYEDNVIRKILIHEYAHALGVGHYIDDRTKFNNVSSLMYPNMNPFGINDLDEIPIMDREVVRQIYNNDGFKSHPGNEFNNYTIEEIMRGAIDNLVEKYQ